MELHTRANDQLVSTTNEQDALVKYIASDHGEFYYGKCYCSDKSLVNPVAASAHLMKSRRSMSGDPFEWRVISKTAYDHYMNFLKTGIESHIKLAERERLHG